jgi:hypothetical protein
MNKMDVFGESPLTKRYLKGSGMCKVATNAGCWETKISDKRKLKVKGVDVSE